MYKQDQTWQNMFQKRAHDPALSDDTHVNLREKTIKCTQYYKNQNEEYIRTQIRLIVTIYDENVSQCEADWSPVKVSNIILPLHIGKDLVNLLPESSSKKTCQRLLIMVSFFRFWVIVIFPRVMQKFMLTWLTYNKNTNALNVKNLRHGQICQEANAILIVWPQNKYYFNFYELLKLSRAWDKAQNKYR